jgi:hypothetical protein
MVVIVGQFLVPENNISTCYKEFMEILSQRCACVDDNPRLWCQPNHVRSASKKGESCRIHYGMGGSQLMFQTLFGEAISSYQNMLYNQHPVSSSWANDSLKESI